MKRSLTALCLLLCLASASAAAQEGANAANANVNAGAANSTNPVTLEVRPGQTAKIVVGPEKEEGGIFPVWLRDGVDLFSKLLTFITVAVAVFLAWFEVNKSRDERAQDKEERAERLRKDKEERNERQRKDIEAKDKDREQSELNRQQREQDVAQRKVELRWRKAQLAREMLKGLNDDPYATDMMTMLDWNGREFSVKSSRSQPGHVDTISSEEMWAALRVTELHFNDKEKFIRDCLDAFFGRMQTIEHYIFIDLIDLEDVAYPFDYYLDTLDQNLIMFENFIREYHPRAASFIGRLKDFELRKAVASPPGPQTYSPPEIFSPPPDEGAYFMFDCPPGDERFYVRLEDPSTIKEAREILGGEYEWHLTGTIVGGTIYYNERWEFYVEPSSVGFVKSDPEFAHRMSEAAEAQLNKPKAEFAADNVWHTGGARLLAELPSSWFDLERDGQQDEDRHTLRMKGRVSDMSVGLTGRSDK